MLPSLLISPSGVMLLGRDLHLLHESSLFKDAFGAPSRTREIKMHPRGNRIAMVWDDWGLVAYEDQPEGHMSHLHLAFDPSETPEHPTHASTLLVEVNGNLLSDDTTERTLPVKGVTPIPAGYGGRYYYESDRFVIDFRFEKRRDSRGRKIATRRLASVSLFWKLPFQSGQY